MKKQAFATIIFALFASSCIFAQTNSSPEPSPNEFIMVEKEPVVLNMDELKQMIGYPPQASEREIEGKVIIRILLDEEGNYLKDTVLRDPNPILTKAVRDKINLIRFEPAIQNKKPVKFWFTIPFEFKLRNSTAQYGLNSQGQSIKFYNLKDALEHPNKGEVTMLYLHGQNLKEIPSEIYEFPNLTYLELGDNQITEIPEEILRLPRLKYLGLAWNKLKALPSEIQGLPDLQTIDIRGNAFSKQARKSLSKQYGHILSPKNEKGEIMW